MTNGEGIRLTAKDTKVYAKDAKINGKGIKLMVKPTVSATNT